MTFSSRWYIEDYHGIQNVIWAYAPAKPTSCYPASSECVNATLSVGEDSYYPGDENVEAFRLHVFQLKDTFLGRCDLF